jgi:hypothetical protein
MDPRRSEDTVGTARISAFRQAQARLQAALLQKDMPSESPLAVLDALAAAVAIIAQHPVTPEAIPPGCAAKWQPSVGHMRTVAVRFRGTKSSQPPCLGNRLGMSWHAVADAGIR